MLSKGTMRTPIRRCDNSRLKRAWAATAALAWSRLRIRFCCTVATSFTLSAIIRVTSWKRVKRSNSSGSNSCARSLANACCDMHLRLGLDLHFAQLFAQADDVFRQVQHRGLQRQQFAFDATAGDGDFAGLVNQLVDQVGANAQLHLGSREQTAAAPYPVAPRCRCGGFGGWGSIAGRMGFGGSFDGHRGPGLRAWAVPAPLAASGIAQALDQHRRAVVRGFEAVDAWRSAPTSWRTAWSMRSSIECSSSPQPMAPAIRALPFKVCRARCSVLCNLGIGRISAPLAQGFADVAHQVDAFVEEQRQDLEIDLVFDPGGATFGGAHGDFRQRGLGGGLCRRLRGGGGVVSRDSTFAAGSIEPAALASTSVAVTVDIGSGSTIGSIAGFIAFSSAVRSCSSPGMRRWATAPSMPSRAPAQRANTSAGLRSAWLRQGEAPQRIFQRTGKA
jgi:hypothetical protein